MAAGFNWSMRNGPTGVVTDLGASGNLWDWKNSDDSTLADYSTFPITAGQNSFETWIRLHMTATFNRVDGFRIWLSTDFSPNTGLAVFYNGQQVTYLQPAAGTSSIATSSIPKADPGSTNVSIGGNLSGSLVAPGYSDHIVMQLRTGVNAAPGDTSLTTISISYNENLWRPVTGFKPAPRNIQRIYRREDSLVRGDKIVL